MGSRGIVTNLIIYLIIVIIGLLSVYLAYAIPKHKSKK